MVDTESYLGSTFKHRPATLLPVAFVSGQNSLVIIMYSVIQFEPEGN